MAERTFVTIGDDCTLNAGSIIQCHSQEDGAFKSDRVTIGSRCTLGIGAFVHYGTTLGDDSVLFADSFLMKGEDVPPNSQWAGNPAREWREESHRFAGSSTPAIVSLLSSAHDGDGQSRQGPRWTC
jgi:acetyltransferase-like isoleucine patch superfamily enzyme